MSKSQFQYFSILEKKLCDITERYYWLLKPNGKKHSRQGEFSFFEEFCFWSICLNDEFTDQNSHRDEYQDNDFSHDELCHNVGISQSIVVMDEEKNL